MTVAFELEPVIKVGDHHAAALVQRRLLRRNHCGGFGVWFTKRPLAILVRDASGVRAIDSNDGAAVSLQDVERLCSGAIDAFIRQSQ